MAYNLRKEKNLVYFTNSQGSIYTFDINTATLYGVKGKPIKLYNKEFQRACDNAWNNYYHSNNGDLYYCLYRLLYEKADQERFQKVISLADSLTNAGITNFARYGNSILNDSKVEFILQNKKLFFKIAKTMEDKDYDLIYGKTLKEKIYNCFNLDKENEKDTEIYRVILAVCNDYQYRNILSQKDIELIIYYLRRDDVYYTFSHIDFKGHLSIDAYRVKEVICDFIAKAKEIGYTPTKDNLFYQIAVVKKTFLLMQENRVERNLESLYSEHTKVWEYEDDTFKIVVPKSEEDFQNEANQQHNCVYNLYLEKAVEKQTHICFFRKKENPEKSYITCEIRNGKVYQFLKAYNQRIDTDEDKKLLADFSDFLSQNW